MVPRVAGIGGHFIWSLPTRRARGTARATPRLPLAAVLVDQASAQQPAGKPAGFFVTSSGTGTGDLGGLAVVYGQAAGYYHYLTINAYNPWALVGPQSLAATWLWNAQSDLEPAIGPLPYFAIGAFLLAVNILLLMAGNFMEPSSIMLIFAPIVFPVAMKLGIDPVHLGVMMVVNMEVGMCHPPVGLNLFLASYRFKRPILEVCRAALPMMAILGAGVLVITYVPWLTTGLLSLFGQG